MSKTLKTNAFDFTNPKGLKIREPSHGAIVEHSHFSHKPKGYDFKVTPYTDLKSGKTYAYHQPQDFVNKSRTSYENTMKLSGNDTFANPWSSDLAHHKKGGYTFPDVLKARETEAANKASEQQSYADQANFEKQEQHKANVAEIHQAKAEERAKDAEQYESQKDIDLTQSLLEKEASKPTVGQTTLNVVHKGLGDAVRELQDNRFEELNEQPENLDKKKESEEDALK